MNEEEQIQAGFADALKGLYKVLMTSYSTADGNKQVEKKADEAFKAGVALARRTGDRALALL
ncbi:MAG TPA: hypothetical protein VMF52_20650 [Steroidobacteraceae bacterium]|nr:hypothetical protein [Steroidobacteraceae bacterium]